VFDPGQWRAGEPLRVVLIGRESERRGWCTQVKISMVPAVCY
jgi:hypothetical protein